MATQINQQWQEEYDDTAQARRVLVVDATGELSSINAAPAVTLIDEASSTVTYIGEAPAGTGSSAASWRLKRLSTSGTITTISWADSNTDYDNAWTDRATKTYG